MPITLSATHLGAYDRGVDYLRSLSNKGAVVQGQEFYRINQSGGWDASADPFRQTITLETNVSKEVIKTLLNITKSRSVL